MLGVDDMQFLREHMKLAYRVAGIEATSMDLRAGNELFEDGRVFGVTPNYTEVRSIGTAFGRPLNDVDDTHRSPICVLGADVAQKLFPNVSHRKIDSRWCGE